MPTQCTSDQTEPTGASRRSVRYLQNHGSLPLLLIEKYSTDSSRSRLADYQRVLM